MNGLITRTRAWRDGCWRRAAYVAAVLASGLFTTAAGAAHDPAVNTDQLTVSAGRPVMLSMQLPGGESWTDANVGWAVVRTHGRQDELTLPEGDAGAAEPPQAELTIDRPGFALVIVDAGPASEKGKPDAFQRTTWCTKIVLRVLGEDLAENATWRNSNPGITAKAGNRIEILPLFDPTSLTAGSDMPVRIYFEGDKQVGQTVHAYGPAGEHLTLQSDPMGIGTFHLPSAGRWQLRYQKVVDGVTYTADFLFELAPKAETERTRKGEGR